VLQRRSRPDLHEDLRVWIDVFYREYYVSRDLFLSRGEAVADYLEGAGWIEPGGERWAPTPAGVEVLTVLIEQTRGVIEFYDTLTRVLQRAGGQGLRSGLLEETREAFENARILGTARRTEAASDSSFDNALAWMGSRAIIRAERVTTGKRAVRDTRYAPGERWSDLDSVRSLLAGALTDR
jgi:hypothetical protein